MNIDYSEKMPDLIFKYNHDHKPNLETLPNPQNDPVLPGARVSLRKVGIAPVDLPIVVKRRDGATQQLQSQASLYCSLDDPNAKGLNLSRLYLIMHETIKDHLTIDGIKGALSKLAEAQASKHAYCKLRFKYPWYQNSLRSVDKNGKPLRGHIAYDVEIEGQYHDHRGSIVQVNHEQGQSVPDVVMGKQDFKFYLTVKYVYSSTCPCSFELAYDARKHRNVAANAHSQRSILTVKVQFDPSDIVWIEDLVELCRKTIPTEVQIVVKREDEQAFAELNGANLLFSEDTARLMYDALSKEKSISDFGVVVEHCESLHPWQAIAVASKFDPRLVPGCIS